MLEIIDENRQQLIRKSIFENFKAEIRYLLHLA